MAEQYEVSAPAATTPVVDLPARRRDPDGPLGRLRAATATAHQQLDDSLGVLEHPWGVDRHRLWLSLTWGLFAPLERALAGWAASDPGMLDIAARARADLALADLRVLGADDADLAQLRECRDVPVIADRAEALGIVYVLDGSTLGGKLIADAVVSAGVPREATTSLTGHEGAGRRWRDTMAAVEDAGPDAVPAMSRAALATFAAYRGWLAPLGASAP